MVPTVVTVVAVSAVALATNRFAGRKTRGRELLLEWLALVGMSYLLIEGLRGIVWLFAKIG